MSAAIDTSSRPATDRRASASRLRQRTWYPKVALLGVIVGFAALTSLVALKTPAWEAADEPDHVQNVETLAAGHWYRIPLDPHRALINAAKSGGFVGDELHQPPLYYLLLAGFQRLAGQPARQVRTGRLSIPFTQGGVYLHHSSAQHRFLLWLRLPNVFLGMMMVWLTFLTARLLSTDPWTPVVAAATAAFIPRLAFLSAFVTNDNLVNLLGAALAYSAVRCVISPSRLWTVAVGAILGLLAITKLTALPVVVVLIPVALASRGWLRRGQVIGLAVFAMLIVSGWYFIQNDVRYGDPLARAASQNYLTAIGGLGNFGGPYVVKDTLRLVFSNVPARMLQQFWYNSGWGQFQWPTAAWLPFWLVLAFALSGLGARKKTDRSEPHRRKALVVLAVLAAAGFLSVWIVAFDTATYGPRLALVGWPALACLAAVGLERWKLPIRFVLPVMCCAGTVIAIQQHVLSVPWYH